MQDDAGDARALPLAATGRAEGVDSAEHSSKLRAALLAIFFVSGASALIYQIVWLKYLGLTFGNTVYAAATLIAIYLAGLGIGGYLFARFFRRVHALLLYALLEGLVGAIGAFSPNFFASLDAAYISTYRMFEGQPLALAVGRALLAALFLLPPTILMGGTLPLLVRWLSGDRLDAGRHVSNLYAVNTFGATAGVALAGFVTIPTIGLLATILLAVSANFALGALSLLMAWRSQRATPPPAEAPPEAAPAAEVGSSVVPGGMVAVAVASFLMGMSSIADEVFWSRILVLHLGSSVYAYSLMLFCFLAGIALGSAVVSRIILRVKLAGLLGWLECLLAVSLALQIHAFTRFPDLLETLARGIGVAGAGQRLLIFLLGVTLLLLVPTSLMGATFPVAVKMYSHARAENESRSVGSVYLFNTIGSIVGSLAAGFLLVRTTGSQNGLFLMAAVNLLVGAFFLLRSSRRRWEWVAVGATALLYLGSFAAAKPDQVLLSAGLFADARAPIVLFREDVTATVSLRRFTADVMSLELNGVNVAGTSRDLKGTQKLQGHLPLLMHPHPESVLHIGFGSGGTAYAVSLHPVRKIVIAEISPEVLQVSNDYLQSENHRVLADPRVETVINDGRNFLLATPDKFDVILSDSIHPRYAGNGSLYTLDYFELCRSRLRPNGIVSMWLPTYSLTTRNYLMILSAFRRVFPNTTVWYVPNVPNAFTIVIGRTEPGPIPLARIGRRMTGGPADDLATVGIRNAYDFAGALLLDPQSVARLTATVPPHVDDLPAVEYESGRLIDREGSWLENFLMLIARPSPLRRAFEDVPDPSRLEEANRRRRERLIEHATFLTGAMQRRNAPGR